MGLTFGSTAKTVSPTRPLEVEAIPDSLTAKFAPVIWASAGVYIDNMLRSRKSKRTLQKYSIGNSN